MPWRSLAVDTIVFDKTGTLTEGRPRLVNAIDISPEMLGMAGALAGASRHPLAQALAAASGTPRAPAQDIRETPGAGLSGIVAGQRVKLGSRGFCGLAADTAVAGGDDGAMEIWLAVEGAPPQRFAFADRPRADAAEVVAALKRHGYGL